MKSNELRVEIQGSPYAYRVWLYAGVQSFPVGPDCETGDEAQWYADKLRKALSIGADAAQPDERAAFDIALDALDAYKANWDTGAVHPYAQSERIAMECAVEAVRDALNDARAAVAQPDERAAPPITLSGAQLLEALDFIAPDRATDSEQLESEVSIQRGDGHSGKATYCWSADYPEEGAIMLDGSLSSAAVAQAGAAQGVPEGWKVVRVKNFDALMSALDRAESKGYLPDAMAGEWTAFEFYAAPQPVSAPSTVDTTSGDALGYAQRLVTSIWEKWYRHTAPQWKPLDDMLGVLTQIDNMVAGMSPTASDAAAVAYRARTRELARKALAARDSDIRTDEQQAEAAAGFICDTRLDLPVEQAAAPAVVHPSEANDARRMRTLYRLLDAMDDFGNGFPGQVHEAFPNGSKATRAALDAAYRSEDGQPAVAQEAGLTDERIKAAFKAADCMTWYNMYPSAARDVAHALLTHNTEAQPKQAIDWRHKLVGILGCPEDLTDEDILERVAVLNQHAGAQPQGVTDAPRSKMVMNAKIVVNDLSCLIPNPSAPSYSDWPCENPADRECLQRAYIASREMLHEIERIDRAGDKP